MTVGIDSSLLINYYQARLGLTGATGSTGATEASAAAKSAPTAPWSSGVTTASLNAAATKVMNGANFIDPSAAKLDAPTSTPDYKSLFALYQGLSALEGLAQQAQDTSLSDYDRSKLAQRFNDGMQEVQTFLAGKPFAKLQITQGATAASVTTGAGVAEDDDGDDVYTTSTLTTGTSAGVVSGLSGDERFSMQVAKAGATVNVDFDLSQISGPLSLSAVQGYMNGKLQAAGLLTRFTIADTPGQPQTITAGGQTFTLDDGPDQLALSLNGVSTERVSFSAPDARPAVYVTQTSDAGDGVQQQLLKLDPAAASASAGRLFGRPLPDGVSDVRATATAADGSLYALVDLDGTTPDGQSIKGTGDVALLRYDSTGALTFTRTLGAADSAQGYALAVSPDGSKVAVTGTVTGALDGSSGADAGTADSFVSVFDSSGAEQWTTRAGASGDDAPASVAWGADGSVYIAGRTDSGLPGQAAVGGTDAYVQGFNAQGFSTFSTVYGTAGSDAAKAMVVTSDGALVVAGVESGRAVLHRFDLPMSSGAQPSATRDLGPLGGGSLAGLALAPDGSLMLAGVASGGLSLGTVNGAYGGGRQVFAASLSADLQPSASDAGTWWSAPGGGDATAAAMTSADGRIYVTGQVSGAPSADATALSQTGYAVALDPRTGGVGWSQTFKSQDGQDAPTSIAVDPFGASALDKLGLPNGAVKSDDADDLVSATSLRPGDSFKMAVNGGVPFTVGVDAGDTLQTLVDKINLASGYRATASITTTDGRDHLQIAPASAGSTLSVMSGPDGSDALKALGLSPTLVTTAKSTAKTPIAAPYGLNLSTSLSLATSDSAKQALAALQGAVTTVQKAYTDMSAPPPKPGDTTGTVPAYLTAQIAQYQLALARLTGAA